MNFEISQALNGTPDAVDAALVDPGFLARMAELPKLGSAEVVDQRREGDVVYQDVRYLFQAELSRAVTRVVDPERMTWIERSVCDLGTHETECEILPDHYSGLLTGRYRSVIVDAGANAHRTITGTVKVKMPLVGGKVEGAIVGGIRDNATAQVGLLNAWLAR
ncbi:MAG: DUF2505 family protein [Acidimicrobiia bacterium]